MIGCVAFTIRHPPPRLVFGVAETIKVATMKQRLSLVAQVTRLLALAVGTTPTVVTVSAEQVTLYVATDGNNVWSRTRKASRAAKDGGPFATFARVQKAIRQFKKENRLPKDGATVVLRGGIYSLDQPLTFEKEDSGTNEAPFSYRAAQGETVRILGGRLVKDWKLVTDADVLHKLEESARCHAKIVFVKGKLNGCQFSLQAGDLKYMGRVNGESIQGFVTKKWSTRKKPQAVAPR